MSKTANLDTIPIYIHMYYVHMYMVSGYSQGLLSRGDVSAPPLPHTHTQTKSCRVD